MLKLFRKHRVTAVTTEVGIEALRIRSLLDDPNLRALLGDAALTAAVAPVPLDWGRPGELHRPRFGQRTLQRAA